MSDFDGIENAQVFKTSNYILPGVYPVLFIQSLKKIRSSKNGNKLFIAELDIIESKVPERPPGSDMSAIFNMTKHGDTALGNIKALLAAAIGKPVEAIDARLADFAVSAENPFHGRLIRCEAIETTTRAGEPFTKPNFSPIQDTVQARAVELHQGAGFGSAMPTEMDHTSVDADVPF